jgi:hypothetical protein
MRIIVQATQKVKRPGAGVLRIVVGQGKAALEDEPDYVAEGYAARAATASSAEARADRSEQRSAKRDRAQALGIILKKRKITYPYSGASISGGEGRGAGVGDGGCGSGHHCISGSSSNGGCSNGSPMKEIELELWPLSNNEKQEVDTALKLASEGDQKRVVTECNSVPVRAIPPTLPAVGSIYTILS